MLSCDLWEANCTTMECKKEHALVAFFDTSTLQINDLLFEDPYDIIDIPLGQKIECKIYHLLPNVITRSVDHPEYVNNLLLKPTREVVFNLHQLVQYDQLYVVISALVVNQAYVCLQRSFDSIG